MYSNFMFLDRFLLSYRAKTHKHTHTNTDAHTYRDSDEYSIVAFSKNATIITRESFHLNSCYTRILFSIISYPLFVPRIRKGTHLKESVFPEAEG